MRVLVCGCFVVAWLGLLFVFSVLVFLLYTYCVLRGALRFLYNLTLLIYKKKCNLLWWQKPFLKEEQLI